jgi:hypothetical protein
MAGRWQTGEVPDPPFVTRPDTPVAGAGELAALADRLASLADTAELMDDRGSATRFREAAAEVRLQAMGLLDD